MKGHDRWEAFRGESTEVNDLIFSVKRSLMFQTKIKLDVFLANNMEEDISDFKVKGSWFERSCVVYAGDSHNIVAQVSLTNEFMSCYKLHVFFMYLILILQMIFCLNVDA